MSYSLPVNSSIKAESEVFKSHDEIFGGDGDDIIRGFVDDPLLNMSGPIEGDYLDGGAGDDWIIGSPGNDQIYGGDGNDYLQGFDGDDLIFGGDGNDVLAGGPGNDTLIGGDGDDILIGDGFLLGDVNMNNVSSLGFTLTLSQDGHYYIDWTTTGFTIYHDLNAVAEEDNDILIGGKGNDMLLGGVGKMCFSAAILLGTLGNGRRITA